MKRTVTTVLLAALALFIFPRMLDAQEAGESPRPTRTHSWEAAVGDPDRIVLTWSGDPSTSQSVTWRTGPEVTEAFAQIAQAMGEPRFDHGAKTLTASTETLDLSLSVANPEVHSNHHSVEFTDLEPDTLYAYRVGDGDDLWSEWFQFRTASSAPRPFSFIYVGDAQNGILSHWSRLIRSAYATGPDAAFIVHAGDLVNRAHRDLEWGEWFRATGWIHGMVPAVPVPGNHEYGRLTEDRDGEKLLSIQWRTHFTLPVQQGLPVDLAETCYHFDYQGARFVCLNSLDGEREQVEWMRGVLSDNPNRWTILVFHFPIFASAEDRDNVELRMLWKPVIDEFEVDLVLQGHDHTYARGHTTPDDETGQANIRTVYVNSVSGAKMYPLKPDGWDGYESEGARLMRSAENTQLFQILRVDHHEISYEARLPTGEVYDAFVLEKDLDGGKRLIESVENLKPARRFENTAPYRR